MPFLHLPALASEAQLSCWEQQALHCIPAREAAAIFDGARTALLRKLRLHGADRLGGALSSEDLIQEALLDLLIRADSLGARHLREWRGWVARRALDRLARGRTKAAARNRTGLSDEEHESEALDPCRHAIRADMLRNVQLALGAISQQQRAILHLTVLDGLTLPKAARSLGLSTNTARRQRETALRRLRKFVSV
jgi:RNA polymerase sigma factor (sigma-70 family)